MSTVGLDDWPLGHGLDGVVGSLAVHVGLVAHQHVRDGPPAEQDDVVHAAQGRQHFGPIDTGHHRPPVPLQRPHGLIVVDRHDQHVGLGGRPFQVADVPDMQQVETPVGQGYRPASGPMGREQDVEVVERDYLSHGVPSGEGAGG